MSSPESIKDALPPPPPYEKKSEDEQLDETLSLFEPPQTPLPPIALNVGLIGRKGCGLDSVEARIMHDVFLGKALEDTPPADAFAASTFNVEVDGQMYSVETAQVAELGAMQIETAKSTEFVQVEHEHQTSSLDCIVVCYGIDSDADFMRAKEVLDDLLGRGMPAVLAATKSDLGINHSDGDETDAEGDLVEVEPHQRRIVTTAEGAELARIYGIPFVETSALADSNIRQLFANLVVPRAAAAAAKRRQENESGSIASRARAFTARRFPPSPYATVTDTAAAADADDGDADGNAVGSDITVAASDAAVTTAVAATTTTTTTTAAASPDSLSIEAAMAPTMWQPEDSGLPAGVDYMLEGAKAFVAEVEAVGAGRLCAKDPKRVGAEIAAANTATVMAKLEKAMFDAADIQFKLPAPLRALVDQGETSAAKVAAVKSALDAALVRASLTSKEGEQPASFRDGDNGDADRSKQLADSDFSANDDNSNVDGGGGGGGGGGGSGDVDADANGHVDANDGRDAGTDSVGQVWRKSTVALSEHVAAIATLMASSANAAIPFAPAPSALAGGGVVDDAMGMDELVAPELELIAKNANDYLIEDDEVPSDGKYLDIAEAKSAVAEMSRLTNVEGASRQNRIAARKMANKVKSGLEGALAVNQTQASTSAANLARAEASRVAVETAREAAVARGGAAKEAICGHERRLEADRGHVVAAFEGIRSQHVKDRATLFTAETTFRKDDMASEETLLQLFVGGSAKMPGGAKALFAKALALAAKQAEATNVLTEKQAEHDTRSGSIQAHTLKLEAYMRDASAYAQQCAQTRALLEQLYSTWQDIAGLLDSGYAARIQRYASRLAQLKRERYELATLWIDNFVVEFTIPARKRKLEYQLDHSRQTLKIERFVEFADPEDPDTDAVYQQQEDALNAKTAAIGNCESRLAELDAIKSRFLAECCYAQLAAELGEEDVTAAKDEAADAELERMRQVLDPTWSGVPLPFAAPLPLDRRNAFLGSNADEMMIGSNADEMM